MKRTLLSCVAVLLLLITAAAFFFYDWNVKSTHKTEVLELVAPEQISDRKIAQLNKDLGDYIVKNGVNGTVSFYYTDLDSGKEHQYNSHSMRAGASGRIFVMEYIMDAIRQGKMTETPKLIQTLETTVTGHEPSSYQLVKMITGHFEEGLHLVRVYVKNRGYTDTVINRFNGQSDSNNTTPNQTSARDMGKSMKHIYEEAEKGNSFAKKLIDIFASDASPKQALAKGAREVEKRLYVSNFQTSYTECENDVAVITYKGHSFVISTMIADLSKGGKGHEGAIQNMNIIAKKICEAFIFVL